MVQFPRAYVSLLVLPLLACHLSSTSALPTPTPADHALASAHAEAHASPHWDYGEDPGGPAHWAELSPDFEACGTGHIQAPVDLHPEVAAPTDEPINLHTAPFPLVEVHNGHTIEWVATGNNTLTWAGHTWLLAQLHAHTPSEHTVNGVHAPMELHFVYKDGAGGLAVIGLLVHEGPSSPALATILASPPAHPGETREARTVLVDEAAILPADLHYLHYAGSLTTPPCTEGVQWFVLDTPISATSEQIAAVHAILGDNARPAQPAGDRLVVHGG